MEPFNEDFEETFIQNGHNLSIPVLVINSEEFTLWKDHMARELRLMRHWVKQGAKEHAFFTMGPCHIICMSKLKLTSSLHSGLSPYGVL
jgi:hypothetical protein